MTTYYQPTQVHIGLNSMNELPAMIKAHGKKPLLVHGHRPVEDGLLEQVRILLNEAGIAYGDLGQILPNPKFSSVLRGVETARKEGCDLILALGGGSTLQCAKGIAYGMKYKGKKSHLWRLWKGKEKPEGALPVGALLTNPGSGDELNNTCTLVKNGKQKTLTSPYGYCTFAVLDPVQSMLPSYPTMNQVFDIFSYVFVRYLPASSQDQDMCVTLMKNLIACARAMERDISDLQARDSLFWCGYQAHTMHLKGDNALTGPASLLAFKHSLPRGVATSALFFAWMEEKADKYQKEIAALANALFGLESEDEKQACRDAMAAIFDFAREIGMATSIPSSGLIVSDADLKKIARNKEELDLFIKANKPFKLEKLADSSHIEKVQETPAKPETASAKPEADGKEPAQNQQPHHD